MIKPAANTPRPALPPATQDYLNHPSLAPLWDAVRTRLERNGLQATGILTINLDEAGTDRLGGLLGKRITHPTRVRLADLDSALRRSAAASGLVTVTEVLTGRLEDRKAARTARAEARLSTAALLDEAVANAGIADQTWVPEYVEGVRLAGILTRAGDSAAPAIKHAGAVLTELVKAGVFAIAGPTDGASESDVGWALAELATKCTGDAHGLDSGRVAAALVLRAAAAALGIRPPESASDTRSLWTRLGVTPDELSGSVMVWSLRPPGADPWSRMMRDRANLGLVSHLTLHELGGPAAGRQWTTAGATVWVCENPQVLQAAARAHVSGTLACTSGNPASAGWLLLTGLIAQGARVRYHGDFDWPGMAIAARVLAAGAESWRLAAGDYAEAVAAAKPVDRLPLAGKPIDTPWDPDLAAAMSRTGVAVHEEALLQILLDDLRR